MHGRSEPENRGKRTEKCAEDGRKGQENTTKKLFLKRK